VCWRHVSSAPGLVATSSSLIAIHRLCVNCWRCRRHYCQHPVMCLVYHQERQPQPMAWQNNSVDFITVRAEQHIALQHAGVWCWPTPLVCCASRDCVDHRAAVWLQLWWAVDLAVLCVLADNTSAVRHYSKACSLACTWIPGARQIHIAYCSAGLGSDWCRMSFRQLYTIYLGHQPFDGSTLH
jgi:hypothetical protein